MQVSFTDALRGQNARGRVYLSYLGVRKQVKLVLTVKRL